MSFTYEQFKEFSASILGECDDQHRDEFYGSEFELMKNLLSLIEQRLYAEEIDRQRRYEQYLQLKKEFENE